MSESERSPAEAEALHTDLEDLRAVLDIRFGPAARRLGPEIDRIDRSETAGRLVLAAANARSLEAFTAELRAEGPSFRLVGQDFDPLSPDGAKARRESP